MTRLYVVKVLKGHIQFLAKFLQPAKCIDKEGNVAWRLAFGQVFPLHRQKVRESKDDDQSSSYKLSAFCLRKKSTNRVHGGNLLQEIPMGPKSEIEFLYPRWPLSATVIAEYS